MTNPVESRNGISGPSILFAFLLAAVTLLAGCSSDDGGTRPRTAGTLSADCVGCHTDRDLLVATADPDAATTPEGSGEG